MSNKGKEKEKEKQKEKGVILQWIIEYAAANDLEDVLENLLGSEETSFAVDDNNDNDNGNRNTCLAHVLLASLKKSPEVSDFHADESIRFSLLLQAAGSIYHIERLVAKISPDAQDIPYDDLRKECYYQAVLCFKNKKELMEHLNEEEISPSQAPPLSALSQKHDSGGSSDTNNVNSETDELVFDALRKLGAEVFKSKNTSTKALMQQHKLSAFETMLTDFIATVRSVLPQPTLVQFASKRQDKVEDAEEDEVDVKGNGEKEFSLQELYFAWDGRDDEWNQVVSLSHPDIVSFYKNNPSTPRDVREYVKGVEAKAQQKKATPSPGSATPASPFFSNHQPSPLPSSYSSSSSSYPASFPNTPASPVPRKKQPTAKSSDKKDKDKEKEKAKKKDSDEEMEEEEKEIQKQKEKEKGKGEKRKEPEATSNGFNDLGKTLREKSKRLHKMGKDPLDEALKMGDEIQKAKKQKLNGKKKGDSSEDESEEEAAKKKNNLKKNKKDKDESSEEEKSEEESGEESEEEKPKKNEKTFTKSKPQAKTTEDEEEEEEEEEKEESEEESEEEKLVKNKPIAKKTNQNTNNKQNSKGKQKDDSGSESDKPDVFDVDSDDDFASPPTATRTKLKSPAKAPKIKIRRSKFSLTEEQYLKKGVERFGVGKWKEILLSYNFNDRTTIDLKDKWRNLEKKKK